MDAQVLAQAMTEAQRVKDYTLYHAIKFSDAMLKADIEAGGYGIRTHPRQARELLRLDTPARRLRAYDEAGTLQNLQGGILSSCISRAVSSLLSMIEQGREGEEMYAEKAARVHREREEEARRVTGRRVILYPPEMRRN